MSRKIRGKPARDILALLGATLLIVQSAEKALKAVMTWALPKDGLTTYETFQRQQTEDAKRTIGYFLGQLRQRVDVHPTLDADLVEFLNKRNTLAHNLSEVDGIDFQTPEGRAIAEVFLGRTATLAAHILKVFLGLMRDWQDQVGLDIAADPEAFNEIDTIYKPAVGQFFREKPD